MLSRLVDKIPYSKQQNKGNSINYRKFSDFYLCFSILSDFLVIILLSLLFINIVSIYYGFFLSVVLVSLYYNNGAYSLEGDAFGNYFQLIVRLSKSYVQCFILFCVFAFLTQAAGAAPHRDKILLLFTDIVAVSFVIRIGFLMSLSFITGCSSSRVLVIGTGGRASHLATEIHLNARGMEFVGLAKLPDPLKEDVSGPLTHSPEEIEQLAKTVEDSGAGHVVLAIDDLNPDDFLKSLELFRNLPALTYIYNSEYSELLRQHHACSFGSCTVMPLTRGGGKSGLFIKRLADILMGSIILIACAPLLLFTAIAIKLDSEGPVLYVTERIGLNGKPFSFWKFRSMITRTEEQEIAERRDGMDRVFSGNVSSGDLTKVVRNDQITNVGSFIRKASIDELPQLFSVLIGTMSLVGPRPPLPYEVEHYKSWHMKRFDAKPGITGLWQLLARSRTTHDEMVLIDLYYLENQTFMMDIEILIKTIPVVLSAEGAK
jgi:exopolysaccharide biosynthesis polyprenyl glycosylphosphotransferase